MEKVVPEFLEKLLVEQYGKEIEENTICNLIKPKKVTLRVNTIKSNTAEIKTVLEAKNISFRTVNWYKDAFIIENVKEDRIKELEIYKHGKIYVINVTTISIKSETTRKYTRYGCSTSEEKQPRWQLCLEIKHILLLAREIK